MLRLYQLVHISINLHNNPNCIVRAIYGQSSDLLFDCHLFLVIVCDNVERLWSIRFMYVMSVNLRDYRKLSNK